MKEERVTFNAGQLRLEGLLARSPDSDNARPAVVCHPHPLYGGSMHNNVVEAVLDAFWQLGFATLRFNFRGVGGSEGEHGGGQGEVEDAKAAMGFILSQPAIAQNGGVMAGYSFGAAIAMRAGAALDKVDTIVAVALPVAMGDFSAAAKSGKRIVFAAGDRDGYCSEAAISNLAGNIGESASLKMIRGADHFFGGDEKNLTSALAELVGR